MPTPVQTETFALNISSIPELKRKFVNTDYFASVCHEIRTPLNAIVGLASILASPNMPVTKQKECARMLQDSSNMLSELLNDLLDSFKIDNSAMSLEHITFDLAKVLEEARNILTVKAKQKGLDIHLQIDKDTPTLYVGDPLRIRQILLNLLSNAVKFTHNGVISIHMAEQATWGGFCEVCITVADCGIGIEKEKLGNIFDKYIQADTSVSREYGGTGLGLFISQELAHLMKGNITVKSWPQMGSHFTLTLPLEKAALRESA
jgi:signal transduction histidine kinase